MSSKNKIKVTKGIRHYQGVDITGLAEGTDADISPMLEQGKSKIRITTMIDTDILEELKNRAKKDGDGHYQTYLNQILREVLLGKGILDEDRVTEIVKQLVKTSSLKQKRA